MIRQLGAVLGPEHRAAYRHYLAALVLYNVLQGAAYVLLVPVFRDLLSGHTAAAARWFAALAAATVASWVLSYVHQQMGFALGLVLSKTLHHRLGDHLVELPIGWFTGNRVGDVGQLTSKGVTDIMGLPAHIFQPLVSAVVTPLTVLAGLFVFDWQLGLCALAGVPLVAVVFRWAARLAASNDAEVHQAGAEAAGRIVEYARLQPVLRSAGRTGDTFGLLTRALRAQRDAGRRQLRRSLPGLGASALAVQLVFTALLVIGVAFALDGTAQVPVLIAALVLLARFAEPLAAAAEYGSVIRMARNSLTRIQDILATPPLPEPSRPRHPDGHRVEFCDVDFAYDDAHPVLTQVRFTVPPGTTTALVGASGSGKTTILWLLARFLDVDAGSIRIGDVDVREIASEELTRHVSLVFQDVYLFEGTIADNIRVGRPDATDDQLQDAARHARVDEVVARLPDGWDTQVGEGGFALSGGERQRVSIARALLKDAPIILLDEATAAVDPENEAAISEALASLTHQRTVLVVAHRLSTIATADQILVVADGRIAEAGTHAELLEQHGRYAGFWHQRARARGWHLAPSRQAGVEQ